ncbi:MAG: C4-type zinc ribbon domain-containing protein [Candidatus Marinimicrobia bacterium]|nr:C4-type zinc ribbon domain-containing protein [Candidatus Neomarinimicrobiota bacterium]
MQKVLQHLVELQKLDTRLDELIEKLGDLPETVKTLKIQINNEKEQNDIRKTSIEENATLIRGNSAKIEDMKEKISKYKEQLFLVTTNREYDALTAEIEFNETGVKEAEDQVLQSEEETEHLTKAYEDSIKNIEDMEKKLEEAKSSLAATQKETEKEKKGLEDKRAELVKLVPRNFYSVYQRVRKARNGLAVVPLMRDACSGCHNRVIPQKRVDIYKKNQVITCDFCGRFLYTADPENDDEE